MGRMERNVDLLTDPRQFVLGLAMMAADVRSGLSREERLAALYWVEAEEVPASWHPRIEAFLHRRACPFQAHTHVEPCVLTRAPGEEG